MTERKRSEQISLRVTPKELVMLKTLAEENGISQSDVIRMLVRHKWKSQKRVTTK